MEEKEPNSKKEFSPLEPEEDSYSYYGSIEGGGEGDLPRLHFFFLASTTPSLTLHKEDDKLLPQVLHRNHPHKIYTP